MWLSLWFHVCFDWINYLNSNLGFGFLIPKTFRGEHDLSNPSFHLNNLFPVLAKGHGYHSSPLANSFYWDGDQSFKIHSLKLWLKREGNFVKSVFYLLALVITSKAVTKTRPLSTIAIAE